jgi:acetyl esterase/lipase
LISLAHDIVIVIDREIEQGKVSPRPNTDIDLLSTSFLANLKFLGHHSQELLSLHLLSASMCAFNHTLSYGLLTKHRPDLAPAGSYIDYPRTFISIGGCEAWRRENEQLRDLMVQDGVDVTFDIQEDAVHDFWGFGSAVPSTKARTQVARNATEWISAGRLSGTKG